MYRLTVYFARSLPIFQRNLGRAHACSVPRLVEGHRGSVVPRVRVLSIVPGAAPAGQGGLCSRLPDSGVYASGMNSSESKADTTAPLRAIAFSETHTLLRAAVRRLGALVRSDARRVGTE